MSGIFNWSSEAFSDIYNAIKYEGDVDLDTIDFSNIKNDLSNVLITPTPSDQSRTKLGDGSKPVTLPNGAEAKFNQAFIEVSSILSNELNLDELNAAELLLNSSEISYKRGTSMGDSARLSFYSRYDYILNILGYLSSQKRLDIVMTDYNHLMDNIIKSFEKIYKLISILNDLIDKQKVTSDINSLAFINCINYSKNQLFKAHELLGSVLFGLVDNYYSQFGTLANYKKLMELISKNINDEDILVIHFLPSILQLFKKLLQSSDENNVDIFYKTITTSISQDYTANYSSAEEIDLSKTKLTGFEVVTSFIFLTEFIPWCKESTSRTAKYDFKDGILKYMEWLVSYGVMERLLSYCSETSNLKTQQAYEWSNMYDFRALLQRNFPKLTPTKFVYPGSQELSSIVRPGFENVVKLVDISFLTLDPTLNETLVAPFFQSFFSSFISNAAIVLTSLRDSEEDFVLSSMNRKEEEEDDDEDDFLLGDDHPGKTVGLDLDKVAQRAELERFYLAFAYTYNNRPELCELFWSDEQVTNDIIGFISWGLSNNTSALITATFCLLLGSLASAGSDAASRIWEILVHNNNNTIKKNDFSKISVDSLYDSLKYYIDSLNESFEQDLNDQLKLKQKKQDFLFSANPSKKESEESGENRIVIQLAEDSVVFISGFMQLLSSIVKNLSTDFERSKEIKSVAYTRFAPIISGFLKFDNLISGSKYLQVDINSQSTNNPKFVDLPNIFVSDDSRIILTNLILNLLGDFVSNDADPFLRYEIWRLLDRWMYQGLHDIQDDQKNDTFKQTRRRYASKKNVPINQAFSSKLTHLSQIGNFTTLVKKLLTPYASNTQQAFSKYSLLYPCDLGLGYRFNNHIGIWPYVEFLMVDVFANSHDVSNSRDRLHLQTTLLELFNNSLEEIDWKFLTQTAPQVLREMKNFNTIFDSLIPGVQLDFEIFVKLHHSVAVINYLFESKTFDSLFQITSIGVDSVNSSIESAALVSRALSVIDSLLSVQDTFIGKLLPVLKSTEPQPQTHRGSLIGVGTSMSLALSAPRTIFDFIYYPKNLGTHGVSDFYEIMLFHLPSVVEFALYVGCVNSVSTKAISILKGISHSKFFNTKISSANDPLLNNDRLITTFQSIDESIKIKFAFIDKFEELEDDLNMKYKILEFLLDTLTSSSGKVATVAHFLLGYQIRGDILDLNNKVDQNTLLKTLLRTLDASLELISEIDYNNGNNHVIDVGPAKLSSLILEILIKLSKDPISSTVTLNQLREYDELFEKLVSCQPKLDFNTIWCGTQFNGDLQFDGSNEFIENQASTQAFFSFINQRNLVLQYLSLEFHSVKSITKKEYYTQILTSNRDFINRSPKVLSFLSILNFSFKNFEVQKYEWLDKKFNVAAILELVNSQKNGTLDFSVLTKTFRLLCQASNLITPESKQAFAQDIMVEGNKISDFVAKYSVSMDLKEVQLKCLHSWCQLIEILITDSGLNSAEFILEVLQVITPKINDYFDADILFSEEMVSLCVLLFDLYDKSVLVGKKGEEFVLGIEKLIPLFQTCVSGILNSNSTPNLRSDLYVVANKFLLKCFESDSFLTKMAGMIKSVDKKFFQVICNDAIYSEGSSRITSTLLLEALVHLGTLVQSDFILVAVAKNNALSLLVRSVKRTDAMINLCQQKNSGVSLDHLVFDLTAFRATLYFFVRVAKSKNGALQLIQNELFSILKQSNFLQIDPDIGLNLNIEEEQEHKTISINVLLDTPLSLTDMIDPQKLKNENTISYFEFLIPIFQLITTVLLSMGPNYQPGIIQTRELMKAVDRLVVGVMKRDLLVETKQIGQELYKEESSELTSLKELVKLFTLIDSLVHYS